MEYNDNFVLPPDEVLEKMRVEYQSKNTRAKVLWKPQKNENAPLYLQKNIVYQMEQYLAHLEVLLQKKQNPLFLQKCSIVKSVTKQNLSELLQLYPSVQIKAEQKRAGSPYYNVKSMLFFENKLLKQLIELAFYEEPSNQKTLIRIMKKRLNITHTLIAQI
jgi:hypothetical protein